jgi:uncharacterized protein (DUF58 family)
LDFFKKYFGDLFIKQRFYIALAFCIALFMAAFYVPVLENIAVAFVVTLLVLFLIDYALLFFVKRNSFAKRITGNRFSNGDDVFRVYKIPSFYRRVRF